jgi:tRNA threonylcarbamoyladenosine biosynthesis protein TsaB
VLLLAIDTSERYASEEMPHAGSIGLFNVSENKALKELFQITLDAGTDHAADLAVSIMDVLTSAGKKPSDVELVAVAKGPGSFTGLRVGVSTAKTFAFALGIPAIGVNTLDAIAQNSPPDCETVYVVYDARRGYVYAADYRRDGQIMRREGDYAFLPSAESASLIPESAAVFGPGCAAYPDDFPTGLKEPALVRVRVEVIASLALTAFHSGEPSAAHDLNPLYLRPSAAEEKRREKK